MPSFDVSSEVNWQEIDNAVTQADKELAQRFDFKGVKVEIKVEQKEKKITLWCAKEEKLDNAYEVLQNKFVKRGISLLSLDPQKIEPAFGGSVRQVILVHAGISKENGKKIVQSIKDGKFKVQAQIQDEQVRVTGKKRDDLQEVISYLKENQNQLKLPLQYGNFRD